METGTILKTIRTAKKLRQDVVAEAMGIDASYLSLIEGNHRRVNLPILEKAAKALGVPVSVLLVGKGRGEEEARLRALLNEIIVEACGPAEETNA